MHQGYFINLAQNEKRRRELTAHLAELGILDRYVRLEAINGRAVADQYQTSLAPGNLGLWLTHVELIRALRAGNADTHVHLIEDDTVISPRAIGHFDRMLEHADNQLQDWDLIFTDVFLIKDDIERCSSLCGVMHAWQQTGNVALLDMTSITFAGTTSLFINRRSLDKYAEVIHEPWKQKSPIDLFLRTAIGDGRLKAYLTVPFLTSLTPDTLDSDIADAKDPSMQLAVLFRRAFFLDADMPALQVEMHRLLETVKLSPWHEFYVDALKFRVSDQWKRF